MPNLLTAALTDGRPWLFAPWDGGGPIDGRPLTLNRDLAPRFDVRVVAGVVVVRDDDCADT